MSIYLKNLSLVTGSVLAATGLATPAQAQQPPAGRRPNIVFILADNLGYGELGVYGGGILRGAATPAHRHARQRRHGLNFNVEAQCTPSRSALMTGRFSIRWHLRSAHRGRPRRVDAVGSNYRSVAVCTGLRHRDVGQMASRQCRGVVADKLRVR
jgi:Sulfatase